MILKYLTCIALLITSIARAQEFELPVQDPEFSNQTGMNDWRWPSPPSIPSIPKPNKNVEVCGTTFSISIVLWAVCSAQMAAAVSTCAVSGPVCVTAVSYASGVCGVSAVALGDAVRRCYTRIDL